MLEKKKKSIYGFNHIDKTLSQETFDEIRSLYKYYHEKHWCYKKAYKYFKRLNTIVNISSVGLVVTGTIAGGVTLNPIILGTVSGAGLLIKSFTELKNYPRKIEMSKFAYTTYEKTLVDLRSSLRGGGFNNTQFVNEMRLLDEIIIDLCPVVDKFEKQYDEKFTTT